jgi:hypothetical protein
MRGRMRVRAETSRPRYLHCAEKRLGSICSFTFSIDTSQKVFEQSKVEDVQCSAGCHQRIRVPRISRIKIPEADGEPEA